MDTPEHGLLYGVEKATWFKWWQNGDLLSSPAESANLAMIPKAAVRDPQVKDLYHGELVIPVSSLYN